MTPDELIRKWRETIHRSDHIFTWTGEAELAYLAEEASKAKMAVEVGVYMGRSSKVMLDANPNLHLWAVDPFMVDGTFETTRYFLREEIAQGRCEIIRKYSVEAGQQLAHLKGQVCLVFVDDGHAYKDVLTDIKAFSPLVRPGGILCGHDLERNPPNDVFKAVQFALSSSWTEPVPRIWAQVR